MEILKKNMLKKEDTEKKKILKGRDTEKRRC